MTARFLDATRQLDDIGEAAVGSSGVSVILHCETEVAGRGIAGTLELFHLSLVRFQQVVEETTGFPVAVYQRVAGRVAEVSYSMKEVA